MPVTVGKYKISKICKMTGSRLWLPSCCSRVILEIRPYCSRVLPYYPYTVVYRIHCSTSAHGKRSPTFFTLIARARVQYVRYGTTNPQLHEVTKCASKKSVFFSKIKNWYFCLFFRANLTVLGVLVGSAGE